MDYYSTVMGAGENCFISAFNKLWADELASHGTRYEKATQLLVGNRLRPILMAWGYYANAAKPNNRMIADYAVCIELIHKASILLDDWIDKDIARHGKRTFHIEYSSEEAVLYGIYLINRSLKRMNNLDSQYTYNLIEVVEKMSLGGIMEVSLIKNLNEESIALAKQIIDLETTTLIKHSFTMGYRISSKGQIYSTIEDIGSHIGYCFQLMNDLEPFVDANKNIVYKGVQNFDANKKRKNIALAYLYGACSNSERTLLLDNPDYVSIKYLIDKYEVSSFMLDEVLSLTKQIRDNVTMLKKSGVSDKFIFEFTVFLKEMFRICYDKLGLVFTDNVFDKR